MRVFLFLFLICNFRSSYGESSVPKVGGFDISPWVSINAKGRYQLKCGKGTRQVRFGDPNWEKLRCCIDQGLPEKLYNERRAWGQDYADDYRVKCIENGPSLDVSYQKWPFVFSLYKNGIKDGKFAHSFRKSSETVSGQYLRGKPDGEWSVGGKMKATYDHGKLKKVVECETGEKCVEFLGFDKTELPIHNKNWNNTGSIAIGNGYYATERIPKLLFADLGKNKIGGVIGFAGEYFFDVGFKPELCKAHSLLGDRDMNVSLKVHEGVKRDKKDQNFCRVRIFKNCNFTAFVRCTDHQLNSYKRSLNDVTNILPKMWGELRLSPGGKIADILPIVGEMKDSFRIVVVGTSEFNNETWAEIKIMKGLGESTDKEKAVLNSLKKYWIKIFTEDGKRTLYVGPGC